ncbi:N-acetylneuraminate synthase family protein [Prochlorococcus marinus]|uniref:N-acetylneuraminate synthase family protein n=1 Tax=Prochlorococcus marinus TaxID=1219 RepID=UPI0018C86CA5|nr:N-acetylneuraminate synthase family protein [Prochlorococcus marinus]
MGSNFNQSQETAFRLIETAANIGCSAVKFQLFKSEILYPEKCKSFDLFKSIELNSQWIPSLMNCCNLNKIDFMASCFDLHSFETLQKCNVQAHKIASSELLNLSLVTKIAKTKKRTYISTGMSNSFDVMASLEIFNQNNSNDLCLMQCTAEYPCPDRSANVGSIASLKKLWDGDVGFSDHTFDNLAACISVALGCTSFEKTLTLSRDQKGPDHSYALEPTEMQSYINDLNRAIKIYGSTTKQLTDHEKANCRRNGLYASSNIEAGDTISLENILINRPQIGIQAELSHGVLGLQALRSIKKGKPIFWSDLI